MKFNLGDKVRIIANGVVGIIIARGYNEYLDENDKEHSFEEYQIEAEKFYQCNEDELELVIDYEKCGTCNEFNNYMNYCDFLGVCMGADSRACKDFKPTLLNGTLNINPIKETKNVKVEDDPVNHPSHYTYGSIEVMDYIEDKGFNFALGNAVKYISRAGRKDADKTIQDLKKANWYLNREIERLEKENEHDR